MTLSFSTETKSWTNGPDAIQFREQASAGYVRFPNGTEAVVLAGGFGYETSEIFWLDSQTWTVGPDLPISDRDYLCNACVIQEEETFLIVGGAGYEGTWLIRFNVTAGGWDVLPEKLLQPRSLSACFYVPDDFVPCL